MSGGQFVFPVVIVGFLAFLGGFLAVTPATPAPEAPESRFLRIHQGDSVLLEVTGYYGPPGNGKVFFSTQEERHDSLPAGDIEPQLQTAPVTYHLREEAGAPGLDEHLLDHRVGDAFTTTTIDAQYAFGDWDEERDIPRELASLPYEVRFDSSTPIGSGQAFNLTEFLDFWSDRGHDLQEGDEWPCEDESLWACRATTIDHGQNVFAYRRLARPGQSFPASPLWGDVPVGGDVDWDFTIGPGEDADHFAILLDPPEGIRFQFRSNAGGPFEAGTYEVVSVDDDTVRLRFSRVTASNPYLVGENVYYDLVVVRITRR